MLNKQWKQIAAVALLLGYGSMDVMAQGKPQPEGQKKEAAADGDAKEARAARRNPKDSEEAMEALLIVNLKKDLAIETAEAVDLAAKVKTLIKARQEFAKQQNDAQKELSALLETPSPDKAKVEKAIESSFQARTKFNTDQQKMFTDISAGMDAVKKGKLFVSLEKFEDRVRRSAGRSREGRGEGRMRDKMNSDGSRMTPEERKKRMEEMKARREKAGKEDSKSTPK